MRLPTPLPLLVAALVAAGCVDAADDGLGPDAGAPDVADDTTTTAAPLQLDPDNPLGNLTLVTPSVPVAWNSGGQSTWRTIEGFSGTVYTRYAESIEIGVSADISANGTVWMRVLVDGVVALPSEVRVHAGGSHAPRSFRFYATGLAPGAHVVEVQWKGDPGASIRSHRLTLNAAHPTDGTSRLQVIASGYPTIPAVNTRNTWVDVPWLSRSITTTGDEDLSIAFSAEAFAETGQWFARVVVDGVPRGDVVMQTAGTHTGNLGARSYVFVVPAPAAGTHSVRVQWRSTGTAYLYQRTLSVYASPFSRFGGGLAAVEQTGTTSLIGTSWTTVASTTFVTWDPSANAAITFSGEVAPGYGLLLARAVVDGVPVPGDVIIAQADARRFNGVAATFQIKNQLMGAHTVQVQLRSEKGTGYAIDRSLVVAFKRRHGTDFAQPLTWNLGTMQPRHRRYRTVVICFDPLRGDGPGGTSAPAPSIPQLRAWFEGGDGHKSVGEWFAESSRGHLAPDRGSQFYLGCYDAPPEHRGGWYWELPPEMGRFDVMHREAIARADAAFPFTAYDTNADGFLHPDELLVVVVKPQFGTGGTWIASGPSFAVDGTSLRIPYVDVYFDTMADAPGSFARRNASVGVAAHEMSHALLRATDLYTEDVPGDAYTVMGEYAAAVHLDPAHRLMSGFLTPDVLELGTPQTRIVSLPGTADTGAAIVVYDPRRPQEMFLIENRWKDASNLDGLDVPWIAGIGNGGIAIWRVALDPTRTGGVGWGVTGNAVMRLPGRTTGATLSVAGDGVNLVWSDGTIAGLWVLLHESAPAESLTIELRAF